MHTKFLLGTACVMFLARTAGAQEEDVRRAPEYPAPATTPETTTEAPGMPPPSSEVTTTTTTTGAPASVPAGSTVVVLQPGQTVVSTPKKKEAAYSPQNWSIAGGGGTGAFARGTVNDVTSLGGVWDARFHLGTRSIASFEAQYLGTIQDTSLASVDHVTSHQATGSFRLNLTRWRIQPFLATGAGWIRFKASGVLPGTDLGFTATQNAAAFPLGGGLAAYISRHALLEARGGYNMVVGGKDFTIDRARPDTWNVHFNAGYAF